jgi:DNA modification methylase
MSQRRTSGKDFGETFLAGDPSLSAALLDALADSEPTERLTHGFHTYPAGLHPDAARRLMELFPASSVLDPFCGGGTLLVEALVAGRATFGNDLSPTALRVARLRTARLSEEELTRIRSRARQLTEIARSAEDFPEEPRLGALRDWYEPSALAELEALRRGIAASDEPLRPWLEALFSSIIVKASHRKSDTSAQREKRHRPRGSTAILFHKKAREWGRRVAALRAVVPAGTPETRLRWGDARDLGGLRAELVISSPPYPSTYDYLPLQHLRRVWFDDPLPFPQEIGARRTWREGEVAARKAWNADTRAWTAEAATCLLPGGSLVVVIGDGLTPLGPVDASQVTEDAARAAGLRTIARASAERPDHARQSFRWEHVFAFRKPDQGP